MRTVHYHIINKNTNKAVFVHCLRYKAEEFLANLADKENYVLAYKWVSI